MTGGYLDKRKKNTSGTNTEVIRVRLPRKGELFGLVITLTGGSRLQVECEDGKTRMCRIPGKLKREI